MPRSNRHPKSTHLFWRRPLSRTRRRRNSNFKDLYPNDVDFDGETAERYGYVNRALCDAELDGFVDALARRIASFDRRPIEATKKLVNQVSLPSADHLLDGLNSFLTALTWPETLQRIQAVSNQGLQQDIEFEKHWPEVPGSVLERRP